MEETTNMKTTAVILAAGKGTRMKSALPKVLHKAGGRTMLAQVLHEVRASGINDCCIVVGHGAEEVQAAMQAEKDCRFALQMPQLGTGHCVQMALPQISADTDAALIVCGDTPLLTAKTLRALQEKFVAEKADGLVLTTVMPNPTGYGRILRSADGNVIAIVEEKDATAEQKQIQEINTGAYIFNYPALKDALGKLDNNNAQGEYYLTDVIKIMAAADKRLDTLQTADAVETTGVNDRVQLAFAAAELYRRKAEELMLSGVTIINPASCYIDQQVEVGQDTIIYPNCQLRGETKIGANCVLDSDCIITDSVIGSGCNITKTVMNQATVGDNANIGPFAYLRPDAALANNVKVGDFAEIKNAKIGDGSKIPHLSYIGDAEVGAGVNIGCGTITCNYDGVNKSLTKIGNNVFVGSNTNLVAPVEIEDDAFIGAGSTITRKVSAGALAVERSTQREIAKWAVEKSPKALAKKQK
jgi:bifunctional UDP-N-acetylglucosamine pyrophosphorylase/glucosamine-1-phosphate N-acetyltransferase